jgi:peptidoglycan-associated lipoprotein
MGRRSFAVLSVILICLSLSLISGCASKSYVDKRFAEMDARTQENKDQIERLGRKSISVDSKAEEALQKANDAMEAARAAGGFGMGELKQAGEERILFEFNQYELTNIGKNVLDEVGKRMQDNTSLVLEIMGHADKVGSDTYNLLLGHNRAESAQRYLKEKFEIPLYRMYIVSYGESKPESIADSPKGDAANRRVVLRLLGP